MSNPIISIQGLNVGFSSRKGVVDVLHGISFDLHRGKTTCVVGESGSGKSVTARTILNMVPRPGIINGGRILFDPDGEGTTDLVALDPYGKEIRKIRGGRIGMIFQEPMSSLSPVHTIGNQIIEAILLHRNVSKKDAREMAADLLRQVEIPEPDKALDRYAFEFSGGMRQRAMIAMALSCRPDVLIADEPTTALDVTTQAEIIDLMRNLQTELGMAIMFITHDMGVVAEIADEVVVMEKGHVVEKGGRASDLRYARASLHAKAVGRGQAAGRTGGGQVAPKTGCARDPARPRPASAFRETRRLSSARHCHHQGGQWGQLRAASGRSAWDRGRIRLGQDHRGPLHRPGLQSAVGRDRLCRTQPDHRRAGGVARHAQAGPHDLSGPVRLA